VTGVEGWLLRFEPHTGALTARLSPEASVTGMDAPHHGLLSILPGEAGRIVIAYGDRDAADVGRGNVTESPAGAVAVAVWDGRLGTLRLVRDQTGLCPLFYARAGQHLVASTDLRALRGEFGVSSDHDLSAVTHWLMGAPLDPAQTLFADIRRVPAGHVLEVGESEHRLRRSWAPPEPGELDASAAAEFGAALENALGRALSHGRAAVFLSGGIDSGSVAAAAAAASVEAGLPPPFALCVTMAGADEEVTQRRVATGLGLERRTAVAGADENLLERALERVAATLWPTSAMWAPVFDALAGDAARDGAGVLVDGQGGDDLLDAGMSVGRELLARPRALGDWLRAEHRYTGTVRAPLRHLARGLVGRSRPDAPQAPAWLNDTRWHEVASSLVERPRSYAEVRRSDLTDGVLAAQREETWDSGLRRGLAHRHPLWDPEVVRILDGVAPGALVAGGDPKSPARAYLARRLPSIRGPWPQPALATDLLSDLLAGAEDRWEACGRGEILTKHAVLAADTPFRAFHRQVQWPILSLEYWLRTSGGVLA
jgi:asparagine synthetase B (glutamine-hydrolysing)